MSALPTDRTHPDRDTAAAASCHPPEPPRVGWRTRLVNAPKTVLLGLVRGYRLLLSPWLGSSCRFAPTCSAYALDALEQHGAMVGSYFTLGRLARCQPWCAGGHDPVPAQPPRWFTRLVGSDAPQVIDHPLPASPSREKTSS